MKIFSTVRASSWTAIIIHSISILLELGCLLSPSKSIFVPLLRVAGYTFFLPVIYDAFSLISFFKGSSENEDERDVQLKYKAAYKALLYSQTIFLLVTLLFVVLAYYEIVALYNLFALVFLAVSLPRFIQSVLFLKYQITDTGVLYE